MTKAVYVFRQLQSDNTKNRGHGQSYVWVRYLCKLNGRPEMGQVAKILDYLPQARAESTVNVTTHSRRYTCLVKGDFVTLYPIGSLFASCVSIINEQLKLSTC